MPKFTRIDEKRAEPETAKSNRAPRPPKHFEHQYDYYETKDGELIGVNLNEGVPAPPALTCPNCGRLKASYDPIEGPCGRCQAFAQLDEINRGREMRYVKRSVTGHLLAEDEDDPGVPGAYVP